jgi:hypothetical protein
MRSDWMPFSAAALVIGVMAVLVAVMVNPVPSGSDTTGTLMVVEQSQSQWLITAGMYFLGGVLMTLGLPALLSLFVSRARSLGMVGTAVMALGTIGLAGFAMMLVFLRALVVQDRLRPGSAEDLAQEPVLQAFLYVWVGAFYLGVLLLALGLLRARSAPPWIPVLMVLFALALPLPEWLGRTGSAVQMLLLTVAFTGVAMTAVSDQHRARLRRLDPA